MGFIKFTTSLMLIALFSIVLVTYAINFAIDNNANVNLQDEEGYEGLDSDSRANISVYYTNVETASDAYGESTISSQTEASEGGTQFKVTTRSSLNMARKAIATGFSKIFGQDSAFSIVLTALLGILGFIMIMYAYKAWVGRNPD